MVKSLVRRINLPIWAILIAGATVAAHDAIAYAASGPQNNATAGVPIKADTEDATPQESDGTPSGMVAFFMAQQCPAGWSVPSNVQGRLILGVTSGSSVGVTVNSPMANQTAPTHTHSSLSGSSNFDSKAIAAISCCNNQGAASGNQSGSGSVNANSSNLPFVQLTVCQKQ